MVSLFKQKNSIRIYFKKKKKIKKENFELNSEKIEDIFYSICLEIINDLKNNKAEKLLESYSEKKISSMKISLEFIVRDIDRTFHTKFFEEEKGKEDTQRILEANHPLSI